MSASLRAWLIFLTSDFVKQLGLGDVIDRNIPSQVPIDGCVPKAVACGWWHTLLLAEPPTWVSDSDKPWYSFVRLEALSESWYIIKIHA